MSFFLGSPAKYEQISRLEPGQQPLKQQLFQASQGRGAGGAFGTAADYYRDLLSQNPQAFQEMAAPELRRYREDIIPSLAEQFAGMGSGALSSSGFRNAAVSAGTDLAERLGAIRAQLRQQGAQGLMGIGQQGLQQFTDYQMTRPGTEGFLSTISPLAGAILGSFGGPIGSAAGSAIGSKLGNWLNPSQGKGTTSPYGTGTNLAINQGGFGAGG